MANEVVLLYVLVAIETTLLAVFVFVLRAVIWPMYVRARDDYAVLKERFDALLVGRDGWREVAEQAHVVAKASAGITKRAARLATKAGGMS